jgi:hypothetical protein
MVATLITIAVPSIALISLTGWLLGGEMIETLVGISIAYVIFGLFAMLVVRAEEITENSLIMLAVGLLWPIVALFVLAKLARSVARRLIMDARALIPHRTVAPATSLRSGTENGLYD